MLKPYYSDEFVTLYHGDCMLLAPRVVDGEECAIVTDPPYGIGWNTDYRRFTSGFGTPRTNHPAVRSDATPFDPRPWLDNPAVCLWGANCYSDRLPMGSWLIWDKRHKNGTAFLADAEVAWMKGGHGVYIYAQVQQGCIREDAINHPTEKPVGLMRWCISAVKPIPRVSPKKASKGFQWSTAKRSAVKKKKRKPEDFKRIYGSVERVEFVKTLACAACGVQGFSDNAHLTPKSEKGMGYKGDAKFIAPMCRSRGEEFSGDFQIGCHTLYDEYRWIFVEDYPDFNPETAAQQTEQAWIAHSQEKA